MHSMTLGVLAVVQDSAGRVLLVKTAYQGLRWQLPGGYVERGESPLEALRREVREELAAEIQDIKFVGVYCKTYESNINLIFCGKVDSENPVSDGKEVLECRYFPLSDLPSEVSPRAKAVILATVDGPIPFIKVFECPPDAASGTPSLTG